jgi:(1->4)-alpha-D-glucan 1-alpha-D-glucosylmutase
MDQRNIPPLQKNRAPISTYRTQINEHFDLNAAADCVAYLKALGIDCLYSSPFLQAAAGSTHGYDIVDFSHVNETWGGDSARERLSRELARHGMGQVLDIVPNHMAIIGRQNPWWWDVLENGQASKFASYFDVDWDPPERDVENIVLLPMLGDHYGAVLTAHEVQIVRNGREILVKYYDHVLPVSPRSLEQILNRIGGYGADGMIPFLADVLAELPPPITRDPEAIQRRDRDRRVLLTILGDLIERDPALGLAIDGALTELNCDAEALHRFLERQNYRLAFWRTASHDLGYRRFFDINTLAGLRMESERVFMATHALILRWVADRSIRGLRVDHPDGLRDPTQYFQRLRAACPYSWIVAEKILAPDENLPPEWPIQGSSGYDFMNLCGGLFIDPASETSLTQTYQEFTGERADFKSVIRDSKLQILRETLGGDINRLTAMFHRICESDWHYRDFTRHDAQETLRTVLCCLDIYRTYVRKDAPADSFSRSRLSAAVEEARHWRDDLDPRLLDFLRAILLMEVPGELSTELALRFQQTSAAAMAKGCEDTAFYRYNRFIALNEVGGSPAHFGVTLGRFYSWLTEIAEHWPETMLATSTHDTKRSEDVRARLCVLSEIPERWRNAVNQWSKLNEPYRRQEFPDRNLEYHLYQTIVGAWPIEPSRLHLYAEKAAREAKVYTSWSNPNREYETALHEFIGGILGNTRFLDGVEELLRKIMTPSRVNSLAQTLIKLTAPGVPDFYQGTELWSLTLVDPDNRQPIDYMLRRKLLEELETATIDDIVRRTDEGLPKLWLIHQALRLRNEHAEWFAAGTLCLPLSIEGAQEAAPIAFRRGNDVIAIAPRFTLRCPIDRSKIRVELPGGAWSNRLTAEQFSGGPVSLERLLKKFPVALLTRAEPCR